MFSSGLSTCCSTLMSAMPSTPEIEVLIFCPISYILLRSEPNSLMAMLAFVPESIASILCEIGPPISMFTPGSTASFCRTSSVSSLRVFLPSSNGHSNSELFTPKACSSSSARPVLRPTVLISGMLSRSFSAVRPIRSDSSRDIPGTVLTEIVNEPSLNAGKKLPPRVKNMTTAATKRAPTPQRIVFLWPRDQLRAFP